MSITLNYVYNDKFAIFSKTVYLVIVQKANCSLNTSYLNLLSQGPLISLILYCFHVDYLKYINFVYISIYN